ncbi:hypothetical protein PanWU01x14_200670 [Parasponia andersonii]|uniref:Uncharacterized protein n=1 Tax=Parasponia andersonii TaxID=3476 RepID=A0A2P5BY74_PARAD|nr:hypothetical protein PanWU01x14_200670 [Parasponia andersonii]
MWLIWIWNLNPRVVDTRVLLLPPLIWTTFGESEMRLFINTCQDVL